MSNKARLATTIVIDRLAESVEIVRDSLDDGWQWTDTLAAYKVFKKLKLVYESKDIILKDYKTLQPDDYKALTRHAVIRFTEAFDVDFVNPNEDTLGIEKSLLFVEDLGTLADIALTFEEEELDEALIVSASLIREYREVFAELNNLTREEFASVIAHLVYEILDVLDNASVEVA